MNVLGGILAFLSFGAFASDEAGVGLFLAVCALAAFGSAPKWRRVGGGTYDIYRKE